MLYNYKDNLTCYDRKESWRFSL